MREDDLEAAVDNSNAGKAEVQVKVLVILDQINDCEEDSLQRVIDNFFTEEACCCNGHGVAVDHAEALLENGILTLRGDYLLLPWVVDEVALETRVHHEARSHVVHVLAVESLIVQVEGG